MKKILIITSLIVLSMIKVQAQQRDTTRHKESDKHRMTRFIGQRLGVDSVKAAQVEAIQANYKAGVSRLMANGSLSAEQKRHGVDSLAKQKNAILATMLTLEQQSKIIPSTEWHKNKPDEKKKP